MHHTMARKMTPVEAIEWTIIQRIRAATGADTRTIRKRLRGLPVKGNALIERIDNEIARARGAVIAPATGTGG